MALRIAPKLLAAYSPLGGTPPAAAAILTTAARTIFTSTPTAQTPNNPTATAEGASKDPKTTTSTVSTSTTTTTTASVTSIDGKIAFTFDEPLDYISSGGVVVDESVDGDERIPMHLKLAERLDGRHFVATAATRGMPTDDRVVGPGVASMADMVDVVAGAFKGDAARAAKAMADLAHGAPGPAKPAPLADVWTRRPGEAPPTAEENEVLEFCLKNRTRGGQI